MASFSTFFPHQPEPMSAVRSLRPGCCARSTYGAAPRASEAAREVWRKRRRFIGQESGVRGQESAGERGLVTKWAEGEVLFWSTKGTKKESAGESYHRRHKGRRGHRVMRPIANTPASVGARSWSAPRGS